jgi:hypothetical protein
MLVRLRGSLARDPVWYLALGGLVGLQWASVAWVAASAAHTGAVYGDPRETAALHAASRALLAGHLPAGGAGPVWAAVTAPFAAAGPQAGDGLLALVVLQTVVLLPVALLATVAAASRLAGRAAGILVGLTWIVLPLVGYRYHDYRGRPGVRDHVLPQVLGLAESAAFPTIVALAVAFFLLVRALDLGTVAAAAWAGLATSVALAVSATAWVFLPALLVAFALRRRPAQLGAAAAAAIPGLLVLLLWHAHAPQAEAPLVHWDLGALNDNVRAFREYGWSMRVVQWLGIAATVAALRLRTPAAVAAVVWFWLALLFRGSVADSFATPSGTPSTAFLTLLLPAFPAFVLMVAALPLLVPRLPDQLVRRQPETAPPTT